METGNRSNRIIFIFCRYWSQAREDQIVDLPRQRELNPCKETKDPVDYLLVVLHGHRAARAGVKPRPCPGGSRGVFAHPHVGARSEKPTDRSAWSVAASHVRSTTARHDRWRGPAQPDQPDPGRLIRSAAESYSVTDASRDRWGQPNALVRLPLCLPHLAKSPCVQYFTRRPRERAVDAVCVRWISRIERSRFSGTVIN